MKESGSYILAEGPVFDPRTRTLYFVDIHAGTLHAKKDGGEAECICSFGESCTSVHLTDDPGWLLVTTRDTVYEVGLAGGIKKKTACINLPPEERFNDGTVAPDGCLYMGTMKADRPRNGEGRIYRIAPDGAYHAFSDHFTVANGMAFLSDDVFVHVDSPLDVIRRYRVDGDQLVLLQEHHFNEGDSPDGLCLTDDGHILVALWNRGQIAILKADDFTEEGRIGGFKTSFSAVALTDDGRLHATSGRDAQGPGLLYEMETCYRRKEGFKWKNV